MNYRYLGNFRFSWCDRTIFNPYETFIKALDYKPALKIWFTKLTNPEFYKMMENVGEIKLFENRFRTIALILVSRYPNVEYTRVISEKPNSLWLEAHYTDGFKITVMDYFREDEIVEIDYRDTSIPSPIFKGQLCLTDLDELLNDTV
jgi:hypothetical protein